VRNSGIGFDAENATTQISLAIMKERLRLVGGGFSIESQGGRGTAIEAHVPLRAKIDSAGASN